MLKLLINYESYHIIHQDIQQQIKSNDKIIIITSSLKNESSILLEKILKTNINTSNDLIDLILSNKEIESSGFLGLYLTKINQNYQILTPYQIPLIVNNEEIEYLEINNILSVLSKHKYLILPGNFGISKTLVPQFYGSDEPEYLAFFIYNELKKRNLKCCCHIYKDISKFNQFSFSPKVEHLIKANNLKYTIGINSINENIT